MKNFRDLLESDSVYVFDGAVGTRLYDKGIYINRCYDELNLAAPDLVREVHDEYVKAGADIIETNTFGATRHKLQPYGLEGRAPRDQHRRRRGSRAKRRAKRLSSPVRSARSACASSRSGRRHSTKRKTCSASRPRHLLEGGVDLFILETFSELSGDRAGDPSRPRGLPICRSSRR